MDTIAFLVIAAIFMSVVHLIADHEESRKADKDLDKALKQWREEYPDVQPTIFLKDGK